MKDRKPSILGNKQEEDGDLWDFMVENLPRQGKIKGPQRSGRIIRISQPTSVHPLSPTENQTASMPILISSKKELDTLSPNQISIHLARQSLITIGTIKRILEMCPNLKSVSISESEYDRLAGPGIRKKLEEKGVELRRQNLVPRDPESVRLTDTYLEAKRRFFNMLSDPEKSKAYRDMVTYEEFEPEIAEEYFGPNARSLRRIANDLGLPNRFVQTKIEGLKKWIGAGVKEKNPRASSSISGTLRRIEHLSSSQTLLDEHKVNGRFPPESLPKGRWSTWKEIEIKLQEDPEVFEVMQEKNPRTFACLVNYYQIEELGGSKTKKTLKEISEVLKITPEAVRLRKNRALVKLGIIQEEKEEGKK